MSTENLTKDPLVEHCEFAADFYREKPGLNSVGAIIDLYQLCASLAKRVAELEKKQ